MQDFTKLENRNVSISPVVEKENNVNVPKSLADLIEQPKTSFIKSRMNKDNFWNLIFAIGLWSMAMFGLLIEGLIIMPLIVKFSNNTKFKDDKFFNSENNELIMPDQLPMGFLVVISAIGTAILSLYLCVNLPEIVSSGIFAFCIFCLPVLFYIVKNCPVSIMFNYQLYKQHSRPYKSSDYNKSSLYGDSSSRSWNTDPSKSYLPGNIYHR